MGRGTSSERQPRMAPDLGEALRANPEAWSHFRAIAETYKAGYVLWVTDAKRPGPREPRIRRVIERARENKRPGLDGR